MIINKFVLTFFMIILSACSSTKTYENEVFPSEDAAWLPVNPEHFDKNEAQRIYEGSIGK